jgi:hypothetical protein
MTDMASRRVRVFFYGLFMDTAALAAQGLHPANAVHARLDGFALRLGQRATLVPEGNSTVHGVVVDLTRLEVQRLYSAPGLEAYLPEAVTVALPDGSAVAAVCYNLGDEPAPSERNPAYAEKLSALCRRLGFPAAYVDSIG